MYQNTIQQRNALFGRTERILSYEVTKNGASEQGLKTAFS